MYLVEMVDGNGKVNQYATGRPEELFSICWMMDKSDCVRAWKIVGSNPEHFGWQKGEYWNKWTKEFKQEHFK